MELRKCKECGKMFEPKGREQYCSDVHYRPCPVCGEPVIAKYLSDPARRCDKCKGKQSRSAPAVKPMTALKLIQPMKAKSLFNLSPMSIPNTNKDKGEIAKIDTIAPKKQDISEPMFTTRAIPERRESTVFCAEVTGHTFRFARRDPICGWIPNHVYTLTVDRDTSAYVIVSSYDNTLDKPIEYRGKDKLGFRCASQISFYNYFQPVTLQD